MKKLNLKTKIEIANEMYEASHEMMLELEIHNEYLKTNTAKEINGSENVKELRKENSKKIESYVNKLAFLKKFIDDQEKDD
jgi:hypothetical protein